MKRRAPGLRQRAFRRARGDGVHRRRSDLAAEPVSRALDAVLQAFAAASQAAAAFRDVDDPLGEAIFRAMAEQLLDLTSALLDLAPSEHVSLGTTASTEVDLSELAPYEPVVFVLLTEAALWRVSFTLDAATAELACARSPASDDLAELRGLVDRLLERID